VVFCRARDIVPFPVDEMWLAAFVRFKAMFVCSSSLKMYLAGIRYHQELSGFPWALSGSELLRRVLRFVKRRYPSETKAAKFPVSFAVLRRILPLLLGWPILARMSHDDRLFAVASVVAVGCFLRGGEFLVEGSSSRPPLLGADVSLSLAADGSQFVVVDVRQPKTQWWLAKVRVPCYEFAAVGVFSPRALLEAYRRFSTVPLSSVLPAFRLSSGAVLSKTWMLSRTSRLLQAAGLVFVAADGSPLRIRASSWRCGAVRSALDAKLSDSVIMSLGRWRSVAWTHYAQLALSDLQGASAAMWAAPASDMSDPRRVVEIPGFDVGDPLENGQAPVLGQGVHLQALSSSHARPASGSRQALG
jgi:hypothetical protein